MSGLIVPLGPARFGPAVMAGLMAVLVIALGVMEPVLGVVAAGGIVLLVAIPTRLWIGLVWLLLGGLLVWSYGFNNVPLPLGLINIPLVDGLLLYVLVGSSPMWLPVLRTGTGKRVLFALVALVVVALGRLVVDLPRFGVLAGRDTLYVLHGFGVFVGVALARAQPRHRIEHLLGVVFGLTVLWSLLIPFRSTIVQFSPVVGVQRPELLFSWVGSFALVIAAVWFFRREGTTGLAFLVLALVATLFHQARSSYLLLPAGLALAWIVDRRAPERWSVGAKRLVTAGIAMLAASLVVMSAAGLAGARGEVGLDTTVEQLRTLTGEEGLRAGTIEHRRTAWAAVVDQVRAEPLGPFVGIGYGVDLFGGHVTGDGVLTRTPHNVLLEIWGRTGLVGLLAWGYLVYTLVRTSFRRVHLHPWGGWVPAFHVAVLGVALVQPIFAFAYGGMVYFLLAGLILGLAPRVQEEHVRSSRPLASLVGVDRRGGA